MSKYKPKTTYIKEVAAKICELIANGATLVDIDKDKSLPARSTIFTWLKQQPEFEAMYVRAREMQSEYYVDEIVRLGEEAEQATLIDEKTGREKVDHGLVQAKKLQIDSLKWIMCHRAPKKFGPRVEVEHTGDVNVGIIERLERAKNRKKEETD
ncbi:hypothetical protein [Pleionea sp. CnH1-48]|uniref:terminase small subunit-like protein n=1 Tax=Pleionea sp. CnH1-48 TaxID=2954494 RepID=UPI0020980931|nr:hypothetical protein [Pleionea sp. CnH1-48]MCO7225918.1 hypothetical protein [Pleionea sp. CnH1-48]